MVAVCTDLTRCDRTACKRKAVRWVVLSGGYNVHVHLCGPCARDEQR